MLYHIPELDKALSEFSRVLRKEGTLLCATNGVKHMSEISIWAQEAIDPTKSRKDYLSSWEKGIGAFSIDSGATILYHHFAHVEYFPYQDRLMIDDPLAIVEYLASSSLNPINLKEQALLLNYLSKKLERLDRLEVQKETGVFIARNRQL
jgi:ubiquinone/menaquinone biosynthesis C-methylase UbiE